MPSTTYQPLLARVNPQVASLDRIVVVATSPAAVGACQKVIKTKPDSCSVPAELMTWLDVT